MVLVPPGKEEVNIDIEVHEEWAQLGAQRFLDLVKDGYFSDCYLYRVVKNFIVQWGIPKDPNDWKKWGLNKIKDDPVKRGNEEGLLSFAMSGPNARGSQIFVNLVDNSKTGNDLDSQGFSPFAILKNKEDLKYFANLNEASVKLDQMQAKEQGNAYFDGAAPGELAKWKSATVIT